MRATWGFAGVEERPRATEKCRQGVYHGFCREDLGGRARRSRILSFAQFQGLSVLSCLVPGPRVIVTQKVRAQ